MMSNETYRMSKQCIELARKNIESTALLFIKPSNQGKTHTAHIICRDFNTIVIPTMSTSEQKDFFMQRIEQQVFILDDPSDWFNEKDFAHLCSVLKNLHGGWLKASRSTRFDVNIPIPVSQKICTIMFSNQAQYNSMRPILQKTGLDARLMIYYTQQTEETTRKIRELYIKENYNSMRLPHFQNPDEKSFPDSFMKSAMFRKFHNEEIELE